MNFVIFIRLNFIASKNNFSRFDISLKLQCLVNHKVAIKLLQTQFDHQFLYYYTIRWYGVWLD